MTKVVDQQCPECGQNDVVLSLTLKVKPIGDYSLAGVQTKLNLVSTPILECLNGTCPWTLEGRIEGTDAVFNIP